MTPDETLAVQAAQNQSLFREVNERIEELNERFATQMPLTDWICECADETCFQSVSLTVAEYEAIRAHPTRFPVLPGHERPEIETVVEVNERFLVVEKRGRAGEVAVSYDPREA